MAVGDIYNIVVEGTYLNQQTINSFHYVRDGVVGEPDPDDLADAFMAMLSGDLPSILSTAFQFTTLRIKDVNPSGFEFVRLGLGLYGDAGGDSMPPFVAYGYLYQRLHRSTFHGHKRFAGVPESAQAAGVVTGGFVAGVALAATNLISTLTATLLDYKPCIYSTILNGVPRTTPVVNLVKAVVFSSIATQNSRKFGHGA